MTNIYEFEVRAMCPIHSHLIDTYHVTIRTAETIEVEKILSVFRQYESKQIFQEAMTKEAALILGVQVETIGIHSGVKITCLAP